MRIKNGGSHVIPLSRYSTLLLAERVEDFPLQVSAPYRAHKKTGAAAPVVAETGELIAFKTGA